MSALTFSLLFFLCVCSSIPDVIGIQNLRYPLRTENTQWRFGKRQDLTQPRFFLWKPALSPGQMYPNTPVGPLNYNRYGLPPAMSPIHQSYMFAIPTKVNYPPYQPVKEIDEKRKPGNLHHITIINAIIPKPYMPTPPTYNTHPTTTFRNYRNNKLLYHHQYFNNNNYGRQNMENIKKINFQQKQKHQQQLQKQQTPAVAYQSLQNTIPAATLPLMINKPTMEYMNLITSYSNNKNNENKIDTATSTTAIQQCGRKAKEDSSNSASNVLYYYCNNRILNYRDPTEYYKETTQPIATTTTAKPKTTSTTTTKSSRSDLDFYTTEKSVFLPTPNTPPESSSISVVASTTSKKSYENEYNFIPTRPTTSYATKYEEMKFQQQRQTTTKLYDDITRHQQRYTTTATYDNMKRQQQSFTTPPPKTYDDMKLHSFFTIEDAVTSAPSPQMQVFNDPYQAYRHARKHHNRHHHHHQRQTTKKPIVKTTTTQKSIFKSFFDELDNEDYVTSEAQPQYDYSFFGKPQKSAHSKPEIKNNFEFPKSNQLVDPTHKPKLEDSLYGESYQGKPNVKKHNFDIFDAIVQTTSMTPVITTYKPYDNFNGITFTTQKTSPSYKSNPLTYTTTTDIGVRNVETETTLPEVLSDLRLTTTTPAATITTTEKKPKKFTMKTSLNLRSTASYKYPKQRGLYKIFKNKTISTTSTVTPTPKKGIKYQRQYKTKKLKQFKQLFTTSTSSTTTTSPTTLSTSTSTEATTTRRIISRTFPTTSTPTEIIATKRIISRTFPATSAPTEAITTRRIISRTSPTTEVTNTKKASSRFSSTTEAYNNSKKISSRTSSTTEANTTTKKLSTRRGSKRANKPKEKEEPSVSTTKRTTNKSRRRHRITSTTPKSTLIFTPSTSLASYSSSSSSTYLPISSRTSSTTTTTTMKSIMRIANSKSRTKSQNDIKASTSNEVFDYSENGPSLKSLTSSMAKDAGVSPLPIEIYFKKSQNAKF